MAFWVCTSYVATVWFFDDIVLLAQGAFSLALLQVELSCTSGTLEITYVVSLYPLSMATAVIVKNKGRKEVKLNSAILSHLRFKRRGGTAIQGLGGCSYCMHPPLSSPFELLSPAEAMKTESSGWFSSDPQEKSGSWTVQDVPITILKNKLSRVYAAPPTERVKDFYNTSPSKYETVDQVHFPTRGSSFAENAENDISLLLLIEGFLDEHDVFPRRSRIKRF